MAKSKSSKKNEQRRAWETDSAGFRARRRVMLALRHAIIESSDNPHPAAYVSARAGALGLSILSGNPYAWRAGALVLSPGKGSPDFFYQPQITEWGIRAAFWIEATDGSEQYAHFRMDQVRHDIGLAGVIWHRSRLPDWAWVTVKELAALGVTTAPEERLIDQIDARCTGEDTDRSMGEVVAAAVRHLTGQAGTVPDHR